MLHTPVCGLLGIDVPILQAGMSRYTTPQLVAAVSNAGGLGIIGGLGRTPDELRSEIRQVRELTSRPFGVNHVLCQLDPAAFQVTLAQRVPVLSLAWGRSDDLTYQAHEAGMKVVHMVSTPEEAGLVASDGADVVVAQGTEGGGHVGMMSTLPLVPLVVDLVGDVPVIAAGGIADGRGVAAALALGASGVMLGTRFVATRESLAPAFWKQAILEARGDQTGITDAFSGLYARAISNAFAAGYEASGAPVLPSLLQSSAAQDVYTASAAQGNRDYFPLLAGQSSGLIRNLPGAPEVVASLVAETRSALAAAAQRAGLRAES